MTVEISTTDFPGFDLPPGDFAAMDVVDLDSSAKPASKPLLPGPRAYRRQAREKFVRDARRETLRKLLPAVPAKGEAIHGTTGGQFDCFALVMLAVEWLGEVEKLSAATWVLNRRHGDALLDLYDRGKIRQILLTTGAYFIRRCPDVAAYVREGLNRRGQRFCCWLIHAKVCLIAAPKQNTWLSIEGSGNWSLNSQQEQFAIVNDEGLFRFHEGWMEEGYRMNGGRTNG